MIESSDSASPNMCRLMPNNWSCFIETPNTSTINSTAAPSHLSGVLPNYQKVDKFVQLGRTAGKMQTSNRGHFTRYTSQIEIATNYFTVRFYLGRLWMKFLWNIYVDLAFFLWHKAGYTQNIFFCSNDEIFPEFCTHRNGFFVVV